MRTSSAFLSSMSLATLRASAWARGFSGGPEGAASTWGTGFFPGFLRAGFALTGARLRAGWPLAAFALDAPLLFAGEETFFFVAIRRRTLAHLAAAVDDVLLAGQFL